MSPKEAGRQMGELADSGYVLATCGVPTGTYNYYARRSVIREIRAADVVPFLQENRAAVVAIRGTALDEIRGRLPVGVTIEFRHVLERKPHFLVVKKE
jgi:hypothetical protein